MPLDYSQKQLIAMAEKKRKRGRGFAGNLQKYAFWTGFASTLISLVQVLILASKN